MLFINSRTSYIAIFFAIFMPVFMSSMEQHDTHNSYQGQRIRADNLYTRAPAMPDKLCGEVSSWFSNVDNMTLIRQLVAREAASTIEELQQIGKHKLEILATNNIKNLSKYNYMFSPEGSSFTIRVAGLLNNIRTLIVSVLHENPFPADGLAKAGYDLKKMTESTHPIYQHTSCVAHYMRFSEIAPYLTHIKGASTYLFPITDTPQADCCDANYVTIQELFDNKQIVELRSLEASTRWDILQRLPEQAIKELYFAIKHAALWDIHNNLMVNLQKPDELWFADFEQPSNSDANLFFYQGEQGLAKYKHDVNNGIGYMRDMFQEHAPEHYELWQKLNETDWETFKSEMMKPQQ